MTRLHRRWRGAGRAAVPAAAILLSGLASPAPGTAQDACCPEDWVAVGPSSWELGAYIGLLNDEPEWNPDETGESADQFRRDAIFGIRAGYVTPLNLFVQAELANAPILIQPPNRTRRNANVWHVGGTVGYNVAVHRKVQLFPAFGVGLIDWSVDAAPDQTEFSLHFGAGGRYFLHRRLAIRSDARMHHVRDALERTRAGSAAAVGEEDLYALELSIGISYMLGGRGERAGGS